MKALLLAATAEFVAVNTAAHAVDTDALTKMSAMLMVYDAKCEHIPQALAALVSEVARTTPKQKLLSPLNFRTRAPRFLRLPTGR
jgi:hypothetical protein